MAAASISPPKPATSISRAMILAAGLGTRFKPWTDRHPKALAVINGKSLLQRNIEYLERYGIREIVVNVHHFADQIVEALRMSKGWGSEIMMSDETDAVLETGGGLKKARPLLEKAPFVLMNVDILTDMVLGGMIASHFEHRPLATLAITDRTTSRYFLFDKQDELCGWRNVQTGQERLARPTSPTGGLHEPNSPLGGMNEPNHPADGLRQKAFSGIHVIDPAIFDLIRLDGKFSMVDLYLDLAATQIIRGYDHSDSKLIDVGKPSAAEEAARLFI
jgi:N-acetyl-alpha-D-muramate 1-phosphate uridylyltransferase